MKKEKRLCLKGGIMALAVFAALFLITANSFAIPLTGVHVIWDTSDPIIYNNWYTEYGFKSDQTGPDYLDAFCVENALYNSSLAYELVSVPDYITELTMNLAKEWFGVGGRLSGASQSDYQIAIWHAQSVVGTPGSYTGIDEHVKKLLGLYDGYVHGWNFGSFSAMSLARSPIGSTPGSQSQDYLIAHPVPEPATMLLLGIGLIGLAGVGRRKFFKK